MIRTILVPLDGSVFGEHALPAALTLARKANARVHLVHAHQRYDSPYAEMQVFNETLDEQMLRQERAYLDLIKARVEKAYPGVVTAMMREGNVAEVINAQANAVHADLIAMTTHAKGMFGRLWLGSNTDEVLRDCPVPLLLVHPKDKAPNLDDDVPFKHWLLPLDGTPLAEQILEPALTLGKLMHANYTLLRVVKPVMPVVLPMSPGSIGSVAQEMVLRVDDLQEQVSREAGEYLDTVAGRFREQKLLTQIALADEEQPGVGILNYAKTGIDAIALCTHGRRGLSRMFLGSVADKVVRGSLLPILVYRPKPH